MVDSIYPNTVGYLAPHIGKQTHRHVPQFRKYCPPKGVKEQFNHRHSSLRMTVKRTFGVLKARWKILEDRMPQMRLEQQCKIIVTCCTLRNLIFCTKRVEQSHQKIQMWVIHPMFTYIMVATNLPWMNLGIIQLKWFHHDFVDYFYMHY